MGAVVAYEISLGDFSVRRDIGPKNETNGVHGRVRATNTICFILRSDIPSDRKITYANFIFYYLPHKSEPYSIRLTVGVDRLDCLDDTSSPAAYLLETKLLLNSTISDAHLGARFMTMA